MQLIDSTAKTNWIFVGIIAAFAVFAVGGILLLQGVGLGPSSPTSVPVSAKAISALSTVRSMRIFLF